MFSEFYSQRGFRQCVFKGQDPHAHDIIIQTLIKKVQNTTQHDIIIQSHTDANKKTLNNDREKSI